MKILWFAIFTHLELGNFDPDRIGGPIVSRFDAFQAYFFIYIFIMFQRALDISRGLVLQISPDFLVVVWDKYHKWYKQIARCYSQNHDLRDPRIVLVRSSKRGF